MLNLRGGLTGLTEGRATLGFLFLFILQDVGYLQGAVQELLQVSGLLILTALRSGTGCIVDHVFQPDQGGLIDVGE